MRSERRGCGGDEGGEKEVEEVDKEKERENEIIRKR